MATVPQDPFSGAPLLYRQGPEGYRVYSVGANNRDDGGDLGRFSWDAGSQRYAPDVGVRIERSDSISPLVPTGKAR